MIRRKLTDAHLKVTPQRVLVYDVMQQLGHASIDMITKNVQQNNPAVTLSTVYRVLDSLSEAGLLSKISHPDGKIFYDINTYEHHHIFSDDNSITDIVDDELTDYVKQKVAEYLAKGEHLEKISIQIVTSGKSAENN